jgi:hypothetical protein
MPCQWYVRGGGEGKRRILIGQSVLPIPFGMTFGRLKLSPLNASQMQYIVSPDQRCICIMDPLKGPSLQISSCSSLHRPISAPNTSSYFIRNVGGKRESLSFYCPDRPLYIENVALRAMYSLSMLEHVQSTHEHSMYSTIFMGL